MTYVPIMSTIVPIMGTYDSAVPAGIASALFGRTRYSVLSLLFINYEDSFYVREIIEALGLGRGAVQRELARLHQAGLIIRSKRGNQVLYQANRDSPVFGEIRSLMVKTAGISDVISSALSDLEDKIKVAFIYGSFAEGTDTAASDVDLVVIGSATLREVASALHGAQGVIGREINPVTYKDAEFRDKLAERHHFVRSVFAAPKIFLVGNEDELKGLAGKGMAD